MARLEFLSKLKERIKDVPISEIVENVGFPSRTTFFRSFKQDTGMTPSEYAKSAQEG